MPASAIKIPQKPAKRGRKPIPGESYEHARRRKEVALADLREIEVRHRRGELLDKPEVVREWSGILRQVRAGLLAVTSRVRSRLPHLSIHDAQVFDEEIRQALAALAEDDGPR